MSASTTVSIHRAAVNRANSQYSTGPRTESGKQRSSLNALSHGLTARTALLAAEDPAAYQQHCRQFVDEHQPATATETQLVQDLADTSWRLNRISRLEAGLIAEAASHQALVPELANLGLYSARLSRQFQKALQSLCDMQSERRRHEERNLRDAAAFLELHKHKGIPWQPSDHGFVFSKDQVERCSERMQRQNEARQIAYTRFEMPPQLTHAGNRWPR